MNSYPNPIHAVWPNDFDVAFADSMSPTSPREPEPGMLPWLQLWTTQHPCQLPSKDELSSLAVLTRACEEQITAWMAHHIATSNPAPPPPPLPLPLPLPANYSEVRTPSKAYRPKCIDSRWRYRYRGGPEEGVKLFECTHRCGQSFSRQRKGDWARHERVNFEEWICPLCQGVLSRREKLRDHLRDFHHCPDAAHDSHRRLTLCVSQRPCGFCHRRLGSWSEWLAHVGAHFEGLLPGDEKKTMAQWTDGSAPAPSSPSSPSHSPAEAGRLDDHDMADADSGFFSHDTQSVASFDTGVYWTMPRPPQTSARTSVAGRIAPPILENPRPDVYHAPQPTAGQPYAFPDPENQWSLQTVQSLLGCWTDGQP